MRRRIAHPRLVLGSVVVAVAAVLLVAQNGTVLSPQFASYRVVDQRTVEVAVYVAPCSWTRVTGVAGSAAALAVRVETLPCPLPLAGTADLVLRQLPVSLPDDIGGRAVTDAQGHEIPLREARLAVWAQDGPPGGLGCPGAASIEGVLALGPDPQDVFVAEAPSGALHTVMWPPGFSATRDLGGLTLLDESGRPVAKVGDRVRVPGGAGGEPGVWYACGDLAVLPGG